MGLKTLCRARAARAAGARGSRTSLEAGRWGYRAYRGPFRGTASFGETLPLRLRTPGESSVEGAAAGRHSTAEAEACRGE